MRRSPRVLVVDDEGDIRTVVGLNLGLAGMDFGEAKDGAEAIEILRAGGWDACLLDLMMPESDGFTLLQQMQQEGLTRTMAVVVLSANGAPSSALKALDLGAHAHLVKPFSPGAVAQTLEELIDMSADERDARRVEWRRRAGDLERLGVPTI